MNNRNLKSLAALAAHLKLPVSWLKAEANAGRIPGLRVGRRWLFNVSAVERAIARMAERCEAGLQKQHSEAKEGVR